MIFGIRAVIEAIDAGKELDKVFIRREMGGDLAKELFDKLKDLQVPIQKVPLEKLNKLTMKNHQGVVAYISSIEYQRIDNIIPALYEAGKDPFIVILDGVTDVRNFGAIARTCECLYNRFRYTNNILDLFVELAFYQLTQHFLCQLSQNI